MTARRRPPLPPGTMIGAVPVPPGADVLWQVLGDCTPTEGGIVLTREDRRRLVDAAIAQFGGERSMVETTIAVYLAPFLIGSRSLILLDVQRPLLLAALVARAEPSPAL